MAGRMNPEVKEQWLQALRSGEYKQGKTVLFNTSSDGFCCLGVLCDLHKKKTRLGDWDGSGYRSGMSASSIGLIYPVTEWAGLEGYTSEIPLPLKVRDTNKILNLPDANDLYDLNFSQIADLVEYFL